MIIIWRKISRISGGHAGIVENERADQLSMAAAQGDDLAVDEAYEADDTQIKSASLF